jgi:DNA-binding CsgD family transcriptional regulator
MLDLLGELYETLLRQDRWPDVLSHMADMFEAADAAFLEWEHDFSAVRYFVSGRRSYSLESEVLFRNHYALIDPALTLGRDAPVGAAANCVDVFKPEFVDRNECYRDFLIPNELRYRIAIKIRGAPASSAFVFLYRRHDQGPFSVEHMRLLSHLDSHLRRLAQLHAELKRLRDEREETGDILDRQPNALITVDRDAHVRTLNRLASKLLLARDCLFLSNGVLTAGKANIAKKLHTAIAMACGPAPAPPSAAVWLPRDNDRPPLVCIVAPGTPTATRPAYAILSIADPLTSPPLSGRHLTELYGLTAAEARLACDLAKGMSVERVSAENSVAVSTVRSQLSAALRKCGVERQVDLVRLVCRLPSLTKTN